MSEDDGKVVRLVTKPEREQHAQTMIDTALRHAVAMADLARKEICRVQQAMDNGHALAIDPNELSAIEQKLAHAMADTELLRRRLAAPEQTKGTP
jgi:hypothetical protein